MKANAKSQALADVKANRLEHDHAALSRKYRALLSLYQKVSKERDTIKFIKEVDSIIIKPTSKSFTPSEATACIIGSDWHLEEIVDPKTINGLNSYSLPIAEQRAQQFFMHALRMVNVFNKDIAVQHILLGLLGDFISGSIHEELMENTNLAPIDAIIKAQSLLISGIRFLLDNTKQDFTIVCAVGNHSRITKRIHISTESGNSLEWMMYHTIAAHFKDEKRVTFVISPGYHTYVKVYDLTLRFHHGHGITFQGGIGGLTIPLNKAIAQWNKGHWADVDVLGHWHQLRDGGNFLVNGSMIGYNAFALRIKAEYEKPRQLFFLIDKRRGRTITAPIVFDT